jgi:serine/threonine protein kinase
MVSFEDVVLGKKIGQGAFGVVYRAHLHETEVAVKQCAMNVGDEGLSDFKREAILLLCVAETAATILSVPH